MDQDIEVVYRNGVLEPLEPLELAENQRVVITVHMPPAERAEQMLAMAQKVFAGLSDEEIAEIEAIALDRSHFMKQGD